MNSRTAVLFNKTLISSVLEFISVCYCMSAQAQSAAVKSVTIDVQAAVPVSPLGAGDHFWWTLSGSATNPGRMLACGIRYRPDIAALQGVLYGSNDNGESWKTLFVDSSAGWVSEESCGLGRGEKVYFSTSSVPMFPAGVGDHNLQTRLRSSADFGLTWKQAPAPTYGATTAYADNTAMVVQTDMSGGDSIFIFADALDPEQDHIERSMLISRDGGTSLQVGALPARSGEEGTVFFTGGAVQLPNGTIGVLYLGPLILEHSPNITLSRIAPTGEPIGEPVVVANLSGKYVGGGRDRVSDCLFPAIAIGAIPGKPAKRVYVTWHDIADQQLHILISSSDDSGLTWTKPRIVDDLPKAAGALRDASASHASVAVNDDGVVGVQWTEFEGSCWRFAASGDGGLTFGSSVALNTCGTHVPRYSRNLGRYLFGQTSLAFSDPWNYSKLSPGAQSFVNISNFNNWNPYFRGTDLVAGENSSFLASWVALGSGGDHALYLSRVDVNNNIVERRRALIEDALHNVNGGSAAKGPTAWLDYTHLNYDEATGEFTVGAVLFVKEDQTQLLWPLVFQVQHLSSILGPLRVVNADNALTKEGAAWVFEGPTNSLPSESGAAINLASLQAAHVQIAVSRPRSLRFRLEGPPKEPVLKDGTYRLPTLSVKGKVFAASTPH